MVRKSLAVAAVAIVQSVFSASFSLPLARKTFPSGTLNVLPGRRDTGQAFEFSYEVNRFSYYVYPPAK
jgi:hypothetical protein